MQCEDLILFVTHGQTTATQQSDQFLFSVSLCVLQNHIEVVLNGQSELLRQHGRV